MLRDPATEPEAAHLRNVLRRLRAVIERGAPTLADSDADAHDARVIGIIDEALARPRTNGVVIDALTKANGDLQTERLDLRARVDVLEMELAFERSQTRTFWAWVRQRFLCWRRGHALAGPDDQDRQCLHCGKKENPR